MIYRLNIVNFNSYDSEQRVPKLEVVSGWKVYIHMHKGISTIELGLACRICALSCAKSAIAWGVVIFFRNPNDIASL